MIGYSKTGNSRGTRSKLDEVYRFIYGSYTVDKTAVSTNSPAHGHREASGSFSGNVRGRASPGCASTCLRLTAGYLDRTSWPALSFSRRNQIVM